MHVCVCMCVYMVCCIYRYLESLLRHASGSLIAHSPTMQCFINQPSDSDLSFRADEFSDISGESCQPVSIRCDI